MAKQMAFMLALAMLSAARVPGQTREEYWTQCQSSTAELRIKACTALIRAEPNDARAWSERCSAYTASGQNDLAMRDCERAIQINPNHGNAYAVRGRLFANAGHDDQAMQDFALALKLRSTSTATFNALKYRAILLMRRSEFAQAERDFDAAVQIFPERADVLYGRGVARRRMGAAGPGDSDIAVARVRQPDIAGEMAKEGVE